MAICGIDPGITGGITFMTERHLICKPVPIETFKVGGKQRKFLSVTSICELLDDHSPTMIFIEKQQAMPKQGVVSTFRTGFGYGLYLGLIVASGYRYTEVRPQQWKKDLNVSADKNQARQRATELMPDASVCWEKANQDGVAESALIAYWGMNYSLDCLY